MRGGKKGNNFISPEATTGVRFVHNSFYTEGQNPMFEALETIGRAEQGTLLEVINYISNTKAGQQPIEPGTILLVDSANGDCVSCYLEQYGKITRVVLFHENYCDVKIRSKPEKLPDFYTEPMKIGSDENNCDNYFSHCISENRRGEKPAIDVSDPTNVRIRLFRYLIVPIEMFTPEELAVAVRRYRGDEPEEARNA
jgi:hypothetical protein